MSEPSLSSSIFGSSKGDASEKNSSLSTLFGASSTLPQKPNNLNFTEPAEDRERRERKEEKRRKRKKKSVEEEGAETKVDGENDDSDETPPKNEEEERTVFVGNLPENITRKGLASMFKECGKVKSSRIRSVATAGVKVAPEHAGNQVC